MPAKRIDVPKRVKGVEVLLTCEHAGNRIPPRYASLFRGQDKLLQSHRGWDPGARELARQLAQQTGWPLIETTISRLLIEANRTLKHRDLFSSFSRPLPAEERQELIERYYLPHRNAIASHIAGRIQQGKRVLHFGIHSFTPIMNGEVRQTEIGLLYDPKRILEKECCAEWQRVCQNLAPEIRVRMNYPYRGNSDGLTKAFRQEFAADSYLGIELEVNQKYTLGNRREWQAMQKLVCQSLQQLVAGYAP